MVTVKGPRMGNRGTVNSTNKRPKTGIYGIVTLLILSYRGRKYSTRSIAIAV